MPCSSQARASATHSGHVTPSWPSIMRQRSIAGALYEAACTGRPLGVFFRAPKSFLELSGGGTMDRSIARRALAGALAGAALLAAPGIAAAHHGTPARGLSANTRQYVPPPDTGGIRQVAELASHHQLRDAALVAREITTPQAVWFTKGTPREVERAVRATMRRAKRQHAVPTLVAYDLPYRDCGQYSAGGALNTADYAKWIDGFAKGIGDASANVILEPDGL